MSDADEKKPTAEGEGDSAAASDTDEAKKSETAAAAAISEEAVNAEAKAEAEAAEKAKSEPPKAEAAKSEPPKAEAAKSEPPKAEAAKSEPPKGEAAKSEPPKAKSEPPAKAEEDAEDEDSDDEESDEDEDSDDEEVAAKPTSDEPHDDDAHGAPPAAEDDGPEPGLERDTPKMGLITGAFVVISILVIGIVLGTREYFNMIMAQETHDKIEAPISQKRLDLAKLEEARLSKYQWVDQKKGVVRIPADKATELVISKYKAMPMQVEAPPKPAEPPKPPPPPPVPTRTLPGDIEIPVPTGSIEGKVLDFITDKDSKVDDKGPWLDFDHVSFDDAKSTLTADSEKQLKSIVEILKAYPDLEVRIAATYPKDADPKAGDLKKLATERGKELVKKLVSMGADEKRVKVSDPRPFAMANAKSDDKFPDASLRISKKPKIEEKKDDKKVEPPVPPPGAPAPAPAPAPPAPAAPLPAAPLPAAPAPAPRPAPAPAPAPRPAPAAPGGDIYN